jgi:tetratricopeptide (TPR) repeat protein
LGGALDREYNRLPLLTRQKTFRTRGRRLLVWALVGLILTALGLGLAGRALWPAGELDAAERALRRHDPSAARGHLDRYLAHRPGYDRALLLAARAARRADASADAERFLSDYEAEAGPSEASRLEWALLGAQQGDFAGEEERLQSAVAHNHPESDAILEAVAKGCAANYRWPEAIAILDRLLVRSPGHVPALVLRGTVQDRMQPSEKAEEDFRRAVELAPSSAAAHAALGGLLNRRGFTREAVAHYELALRGRPADPVLLLGLARAHADAAQLDEAQRRIDELLAADPDSADGLVERGRLALRRGRAAEAEPFLARAVRVAPWHRAGQQLYLLALKELGRTDDAARCESRVAELRAEDGVAGRLRLRVRDTPGDAAVRWDLWQWCQRNGQMDEGLALLNEVVRYAPRHAGAHAALADHFERVGQPRRAAMHRAAAQ